MMYYSAILLPKGHKGSDDIRKLKELRPNLELRGFSLASGAGVALMEHAMDAGAKRFPIIMAGDSLISDGDDAWLGLMKHWNNNPHTHWEASDEGAN